MGSTLGMAPFRTSATSDHSRLTARADVLHSRGLGAGPEWKGDAMPTKKVWPQGVWPVLVTGKHCVYCLYAVRLPGPQHLLVLPLLGFAPEKSSPPQGGLDWSGLSGFPVRWCSSPHSFLSDIFLYKKHFFPNMHKIN